VKKYQPVSSLLLFCACLLLAGCQVKTTNQKSEKHGGTLRINASTVPDIIFPGHIYKSSEHLLVNQVYTGLVKYHPKTLEIIPSLAKKWRVEQNNTLFTFTLNKNARFHNNPCFSKGTGRVIIAADIKYCIEQVCRNHLKNNHTLARQIFNIAGSDSLFNSPQNPDSITIGGIRVINDTTLEFKLKQPDELFIHFLAGPNSLVFPKEGFNAYGIKNNVGSGAFTFNYPKIKGEPITLKANPGYFMLNKQGYPLPYVDSIVVSFITSTTRELYLFKQDKLDVIIGLPHNYVSTFLDENIDRFQSNPPYYILKPTPTNNTKARYNLMRSNIQQFYINAQNYFDLSRVYFAAPEKKTIEFNTP
jgi:ABC-type transport system substrate-binding protein